MVLASSTPQFFQPDGDGPNAAWHQNSTSDPAALCGAVVMRYNIDNTGDVLPAGARFCPRCKWIADGKPAVNPVADGPEVVSIPVPESTDDGKVGGEDGQQPTEPTLIVDGEPPAETPAETPAEGEQQPDPNDGSGDVTTVAPEAGDTQP